LGCGGGIGLMVCTGIGVGLICGAETTGDPWLGCTGVEFTITGCFNGVGVLSGVAAIGIFVECADETVLPAFAGAPTGAGVDGVGTELRVALPTAGVCVDFVVTAVVAGIT
jgi:hypothetical protein